MQQIICYKCGTETEVDTKFIAENTPVLFAPCRCGWPFCEDQIEDFQSNIRNGLEPYVSHFHAARMLGMPTQVFRERFGANLAERFDMVSLLKLRRFADSRGMDLKALTGNDSGIWLESISANWEGGSS